MLVSTYFFRLPVYAEPELSFLDNAEKLHHAIWVLENLFKGPDHAY